MKRLLTLSFLGVLLMIPTSTFAQTRLASKSSYQKYVDPLLGVKDFGMHYTEDGAADYSVLAPFHTDSSKIQFDKPPAALIDLVRLGTRSLPVLIDCLSDGRITSVRFDGNNITKPMSVPVGYICLDILMSTVRGKPTSDPECNNDGLGACMNYGFYFRPDDYSNCFDRPPACDPRPWVSVVQQNWRRVFLQHRLQFRSPSGNVGNPGNIDLGTPTK